MNGKTPGIALLTIAFLSITALSLVCPAPAGSITPPKVTKSIRTSITFLEIAQEQAQRPVRPDTPSKQESKSADAEMQRLQGNWQVTKWEDESGEQVPVDELKYFTFHFEGDRVTMRKFKDDAGTLCQFRLDAAKQPKWIDLGMPDLAAGSTVLEGIYSLEGDELKLSIISGLRNGVAPPRPTGFKTGPDQKYAVLSLKRIL